ncbi:hypothetical protein NOR_06089 [Metarhizium rileyi]|uniref:DUF7905 domain-containing protein n=1 Tax=Metarhizium rileyi (strain RCEF 4871) TaxID=1649241 RepID=A0A167B5B4_METRR|nr:hypothetical protein NOR_06089 [Metarhizium rileyi RCEF 4871]TWU75457.1 hypothetical protein ED733_004706 [Metarhizium rileyi]
MNPQRPSPRKWRGARPPNAISQAEKKPKKFAVAPTMPSIKSKMDDRRRNNDVTTEAQYLLPPPDGENLLEAVLILPENYMLSRELTEPSSLDAIKTENEIWIKIIQDKPNVLHIYSRTALCLQEGFKAVNQAIHDMCLTRQNESTRFLVQMPVRAGPDSSIIVELDSRPRVEQHHSTTVGAAEVADNVVKQLGPSFSTSTTALQTIKKSLHMRVDFGLINIRRRKRGVGNTMSYSDFTEMALKYGTKGGAELNTRLMPAGLITKLMALFLESRLKVCQRIEDVIYRDSIKLKMNNQVLKADIEYFGNRQPSLTNVRLVIPERWPLLRWTVMAPDRDYDWGLQVDVDSEVQPIPAPIEQLIKKITIPTEGWKSPADFEHRCVEMRVENPEMWSGTIDEMRTKSSALIPFHDTPFVIEISRNHAWKGLNTKVSPFAWIGVRLLGRQWEDNLNYKKPHELNKDWGLHQSDIWAGSEATAEGQFAGFVCHVLEVLSVLEGVNISASTVQFS